MFTQCISTLMCANITINRSTLCQPITSRCVQLTHVGSMLEGLYYIPVYSCVKQCIFEVFRRRGLDLINILRKLFLVDYFAMCKHYHRLSVPSTEKNWCNFPTTSEIAQEVFYFTYTVSDVYIRKLYFRHFLYTYTCIFYHASLCHD